MKIAFITDQHFDHASRWDETLRIAQWCISTLREERPDVIALGGDMFERRPMPVETRAVAEWVQGLANIAPVVGVYGNHDAPESLAVMNRLEARHAIRIADAPEVLSFNEVGIALLPWPRKASILAALGGVPQEQAGQAAQEALRSVLRGLGAELEEVAPAGGRVLVGHAMVHGSMTSHGQPLCGHDLELNLADLALAGCDAHLLGHVHLGVGNEWNIAGAPALYGGSFRRTAFGELEEKSVVMLNVAPGEPARVRRIVIPCTQMLLVETGWYPEHLALPGDVVRSAGFDSDAEPPTSITQATEVRIRYHVAAEHREAAARAAAELRDRWLSDGATVVKLEPVVEVSTRARAPEVAQARTLRDQLDAHWESKGGAPDRRVPLLGKLGELEDQQTTG